MLNYGEEPTDVHKAMHRAVIDSAYDVIQRKGYTNWAVGLTGAFIGKAVLYDQRKIMYVASFVFVFLLSLLVLSVAATARFRGLPLQQ